MRILWCQRGEMNADDGDKDCDNAWDDNYEEDAENDDGEDANDLIVVKGPCLHMLCLYEKKHCADDQNHGIHIYS